MKSTASLQDIIRRTSELMDESTRLKQRAYETISQSIAVIDRSRELLFSGLVSGPPCYSPRRHPVPKVPAQPGTEPASEVGGSAAETTLLQVLDRDFAEETVVLDGRHFLNCRVTNCVLEYFGGPFLLESTSFSGCRFRFGAEAAMTLAMLQCFGLMAEESSAVLLPARPVPEGSYRIH